MHSIRLVFESKLTVPPESAWAWATSLSGISSELWPLLRMTAPKQFGNLLDVDVRLGQPLFRSWVFLFGIVPIDRSDLTLFELEPGRRFLEQSPMLSMNLWRHERIIAPLPDGSVVTDRLEFEPRFAVRLTTWFIKAIFTHRHSVLRRTLG